MNHRNRTLVLAALVALWACDHGQGGDGQGAGHGAAARPATAADGASAQAAQDPCAVSHRLREDAGILDAKSELTREAQMEFGFQVFSSVCVTCHQPSGRGFPNAFPPLAGSDFLMADKGRLIDVLLSGLSKPITVNDWPYAANMPSFACFSDIEIASVLTFVRNTWGNAGEPVTSREVAQRRARAFNDEGRAPR